jgi:hypothetical protein
MATWSQSPKPRASLASRPPPCTAGCASGAKPPHHRVVTDADLREVAQRDGPIARQLHAREHVAAGRASIRQVRDRVPGRAAIATKVRESSRVRRPRTSSRFRCKSATSAVADARLKIVVSPVLVRVSPFGNRLLARGFRVSKVEAEGATRSRFGARVPNRVPNQAAGASRLLPGVDPAEALAVP